VATLPGGAPPGVGSRVVELAVAVTAGVGLTDEVGVSVAGTSVGVLDARTVGTVVGRATALVGDEGRVTAGAPGVALAVEQATIDAEPRARAAMTRRRRTNINRSEGRQLVVADD